MQNLGKGDRRRERRKKKGGGGILLKLLKTLIHLARQQEETTKIRGPVLKALIWLSLFHRPGERRCVVQKKIELFRVREARPS